MTPTSTPFAFVDAALDRADALRDDADALRRYWPQARIVLIDRDGQAMIDGEGRLHVLTPTELAGLDLLRPEVAAQDIFADAIFLGLRAGQAWFAAESGTHAKPVAHTDLRSAAALWPAFESTVFAQARAVLHWRARHRFCAACAAVRWLSSAPAGWAAARTARWNTTRAPTQR